MAFTSVSILSLLLVVLEYSSTAEAVCPERWHSFKDGTSCLFVSDDPESFVTGHLGCFLVGGRDLVSVTSQAENNRIVQILDQFKKGKYWTGLNKIVGPGYVWTDRSVQGVPFTNFGSPNVTHNRNCVLIDDNGLWSLESCRMTNYYICEMPI